MKRESVRRVRTVMELGLVVQETRRGRQWTQAELAKRAQVSRRWIVALESGQAAGAELGRVLATLSALGLELTLSPPAENDTGEPANPVQRAPALPEAPIDSDRETLADLDAHLATFMSRDAPSDPR